STVPNLAYLNCWRRYLPIFVANANTCAALKSIFAPLYEELGMLECRSGLVPLYEAFNLALNAWGDAPPLLELTSEQKEAGERVLERAGLPRGAWFVGLHVREGAKGGKARSGPDADIASYTEAIRRIIARGGWVIRMGIGGTPLGAMERVWDYANSDEQ